MHTRLVRIRHMSYVIATTQASRDTYETRIIETRDARHNSCHMLHSHESSLIAKHLTRVNDPYGWVMDTSGRSIYVSIYTYTYTYICISSISDATYTRLTGMCSTHIYTRVTNTFRCYMCCITLYIIWHLYTYLASDTRCWLIWMRTHHSYEPSRTSNDVGLFCKRAL